jgi:hypothetical protein
MKPIAVSVLIFILLWSFSTFEAHAQATSCLPSITDLAPITSDNVANLTIIDTIGRGAHLAVVWQNDELFVQAESGWWRYQVGHLSEPACRVAAPAVIPSQHPLPHTIKKAFAALNQNQRARISVLGVSATQEYWITFVWGRQIKKIYIWNIEGRIIHILPAIRWRGEVAAAFNADETEFALITIDGILTRYDLQTVNLLEFNPFWSAYSAVQAISPNSDLIVMGSEEITHVWSNAANTTIATLGGTWSAAFSPLGSYLVVPRDYFIAFIDIDTWQEVFVIPTPYPMYGTQIAISPNGRFIVVGHPVMGWRVITNRGEIVLSH